MIKMSLAASIVAIGVTFHSPLQAQEIATGNRPLNLEVNKMDANHDGIVTKEEFQAYAETVWTRIAHGEKKVPVDAAITAFATGNMSMKVNEMDADHDGFINHDEFMASGLRQFDDAKTPKGTMTTQDVTKSFGSGRHVP